LFEPNLNALKDNSVYPALAILKKKKSCTSHSHLSANSHTNPSDSLVPLA